MMPEWMLVRPFDRWIVGVAGAMNGERQAIAYQIAMRE